MKDEEREREYYRAVEDFFAAARGRPHTLSPKDVQLLQSWWRDQLPLEAVTTAIAEVFARRRERGDEDSALSLGYCRHAVKRQAKRLAAMRTGTGHSPSPEPAVPIEQALLKLTAELKAAADALPRELHAVAGVLHNACDGLLTFNAMAASEIDEHLYNFEAHVLDACLNALPSSHRKAIEDRADATARQSGARDEALERSRRAMVDRGLRSLLVLPRLEIG